jgi:UDP-GlcNAc:undecaprenyl-phosphate GlcNAc-1-phosphate transferase
MGDSGSMFVGYVLATSALLGTKGSTAVGLLVPILAMGLPIMDTLLAIVRRVVGRQSIFAADRRHLHHRLVDMGMTHRKAVMVLYGVSVLFTAAAIAVYLSRSDWQTGGVLLVASVVIVGLMRATGSFHFRFMRRVQRERTYAEDTQRLRRAVPQAIAALRAAGTPDETKAALEELARTAALVFVDCSTPSLPALDGWTWESDQASGMKKIDKDGRTRAPRGYISATFALATEGEDSADDKIKFGWYTDSGEVTRQNEVLLQLVVDEVGRGCAGGM